MLKEQAISIVRTLREKGYQAYFVGGCVRDLLLGREPADYDVATDARPDEVMSIFPETYAVGAQFGVVLVPIPESERGQRGATENGDPAAVLEDETTSLSGHHHKACVEVATF